MCRNKAIPKVVSKPSAEGSTGGAANGDETDTGATAPTAGNGAVCKRKGPSQGDEDVKFCERWCRADACGDCRCQLCEVCGGSMGGHKCAAVPLQPVFCEGWCDPAFSSSHCSIASRCACEGCPFCMASVAVSSVSRPPVNKACEPSSFQDVQTEQCSRWCTEKCAASPHSFQHSLCARPERIDTLGLTRM